MRTVLAATLGLAVGGLVAGGLKVFLLNTGPMAVGRTDWFLVTWLTCLFVGLFAALCASPFRGFVTGLIGAVLAGVYLETSSLRPPPINMTIPHLVNCSACLITGVTGGLIGRAVLRTERPHTPFLPPEDDPIE